MTRHEFTVFVTGDAPRGQRALTLLRALCDRHLGDGYGITVVDVLSDAGLAEEYNVVATPTVIRTAPTPALRALGDLDDAQRVATALGMGTPSRGARGDDGQGPATEYEARRAGGHDDGNG